MGKNLFLLAIIGLLLGSPLMASAAPAGVRGGFGFITGTVFVDGNGNGKFDRGESAVPNIAVNLKPLGGRWSQSVQSNAWGQFTFWGVAPGKYSLDANASSGNGGAVCCYTVKNGKTTRSLLAIAP